MNKSKFKKFGIISSVALLHLFVNANLNLWLFGLRTSHANVAMTPLETQQDRFVEGAITVLGFPLVFLMQSLPYEPGALGFVVGRIFGYTWLLSYILNSILWALAIYKTIDVVKKRRQK